ncbi:CbtB-domain containing protein [Roseovarius sp. SK2]|uniref:CbtB domain-containing protein n=1 Tax=Roseovarius TaxID=74030 RepID=UPI00237A26CF|nr:CbtB-domain containing protein [Roseovarius sp. SK2]MDD9727734.1 CbtB-domain containing protein [Roseovarius sp. SK2]
MIVKTASTARATSASGLVSVIAIAALGLGVIFVAGHVQAAALHDAAHDVRHATGFPCH